MAERCGSRPFCGVCGTLWAWLRRGAPRVAELDYRGDLSRFCLAGGRRVPQQLRDSEEVVG